MVEKILQLLSVSCSHKKTSQPFTASSNSPSRSGQSSWDSVGAPASHYVVCLDCGKKFTYDWDRMRIVR
ncbi:MAG TPA: hypothetical protein VK699_19490 [Terriglobales bacterium]|jgi:hypothetical protein|nr:hypothetical protein [Terriglobales bacterium]